MCGRSFKLCHQILFATLLCQSLLTRQWPVLAGHRLTFVRAKFAWILSWEACLKRCCSRCSHASGACCVLVISRDRTPNTGPVGQRHVLQKNSAVDHHQKVLFHLVTLQRSWEDLPEEQYFFFCLVHVRVFFNTSADACPTWEQSLMPRTAPSAAVFWACHSPGL